MVLLDLLSIEDRHELYLHSVLTSISFVLFLIKVEKKSLDTFYTVY